MTALLIADHDNVKLRPATASAVTALLQMTEAVDVLVAGNGCEAVAEEAAKIAGVRTVLLAQNAKLAQELPEVLAYTAAHEAPGYSHIFFCATALGKATMPRVAAQLDRSAVSDVVAVKGPKTFVRGIYAGALLATVEVDEDVVVGTVRTTAFEPAGEADMPVRIENITVPEEAANWDASQFVRFTETESDRPDLVSAKVVVAGGRGLIDEAGFASLEKLADKIGAAVGATRTAVDMGLCPNDWQVGQTGKMIAPDLYIGFGISGAIQHTAGIKDAKVIVAVNNDPEAPIFETADYGLLADAAETCRALAAKL